MAAIASCEASRFGDLILAPKSTIDRLFDSIGGLHNELTEMKVELAKEVSSMGKDVAMLLDDRKHASEQRARTFQRIEVVEGRLLAVEFKLAATIDICKETEEKIDAIGVDIADYNMKKVLVGPALLEIDDIKKRLDDFDRWRARAGGMWDVIKNLGLIGKSVLGGLALLALGGVVSLIVNFLGPLITARWGG